MNTEWLKSKLQDLLPIQGEGEFHRSGLYLATDQGEGVVLRMVYWGRGRMAPWAIFNITECQVTLLPDDFEDEERASAYLAVWAATVEEVLEEHARNRFHLPNEHGVLRQEYFLPKDLTNFRTHPLHLREEADLEAALRTKGRLGRYLQGSR